jgi:hypothetical protein
MESYALASIVLGILCSIAVVLTMTIPLVYYFVFTRKQVEPVSSETGADQQPSPAIIQPEPNIHDAILVS